MSERQVLKMLALRFQSDLDFHVEHHVWLFLQLFCSGPLPVADLPTLMGWASS